MRVTNVCKASQVLLRKGGIREPVFSLPRRDFLLLPTAFHSDDSVIVESAASKYAKVRSCCESTVTGRWTLSRVHMRP